MSGILIYEEDHLMRALLEEWLSSAGYHVCVRARGSVEDAVSLVIVSVYMPKDAGVQRVREVQAAHPGVPVIAISGQFRSGLSAECAAADTLGVQRVIAKPLARADLLEVVRTMIGLPS